MIRIHIIAEGPTEENFVTEVLRHQLSSQEIYVDARLLGVPGHKGGAVRWQRLRKDIRELLLGDPTAYTTTFFDYFRMGDDFPGYPYADAKTTGAKRKAVENGIVQGLVEFGLSCDDLSRFVPYVQMHEFEGLLFSAPARFAAGIYRKDLVGAFQEIRDAYPTPEDINDGAKTAPSKRVEALFPGYQKTVHGPLAALEIELATIREACYHFGDWLGRLESLGCHT